MSPAERRRVVRWVIATADLYLGGQPGTGAAATLAYRAGDRLPAETAARHGWVRATRPEEPPAAAEPDAPAQRAPAGRARPAGKEGGA